ncbi:hypothetical protein BH20VER1_BH20VER1_24510 [soil metagenome]
MKNFCFLPLLIAALLPAVALAADESKSGGKDPMTAELSEMKGADFEAAYLAMMIHHHQDGVKMSEMVPSRIIFAPGSAAPAQPASVSSAALRST